MNRLLKNLASFGKYNLPYYYYKIKLHNISMPHPEKIPIILEVWRSEYGERKNQEDIEKYIGKVVGLAEILGHFNHKEIPGESDLVRMKAEKQKKEKFEGKLWEKVYKRKRSY